PLKDGVARAYDARPDAPTYLFARGDERMPAKDHPLAPGLPAVLGGEVVVKKVEFTGRTLALAVAPAAAEARARAGDGLASAQAGVKGAADAVASARQQLARIASGAKPVVRPLPAFLHDTFGASRPDVWKVVSGPWAWEKGRLVCKSPATFPTVVT